MVAVAVMSNAPLAFANLSSWDPTLLVNTESFQTIDDGDGTTNIEVRFGSAANQSILWDVNRTRFDFTDDVHIQGNLASSGTLTVSGAVTFDSQNISIGGVSYVFPGADGIGSGYVLGTDATGNLSWTEGGITQSDADDYYVNVSGDTMTGALVIANGAGLTTSGAIQTESNITLNKDNAAQDATLTFGNDAGAETITFSDTTEQFEFSDDVDITGTLHTSGDATMSGTLKVEGDAATDGNLTINQDNSAADATLTFGNDAGAETLIFSDTYERFEFSDDLYTSGNIEGSGSLVIEGSMSGDTLNVSGDADVGGDLDVEGNITGSGDLVIEGTMSGDSLTVSGTGMNLAGNQYYMTTSQGGANEVLINDGNGNLTWGSPSVGNGSGNILFLSPEYPHAIYFGSGSTDTGQLSASGSVAEGENFYFWESSKNALNDYWISVRVRVPDNFSSWDPVAPIQFRYQSSSANVAESVLKVEMLDTAGARVPLTGSTGLANTSWTTANITGPESAGTYNVGEYITVFIKMASIKNHWVKAGWLEFNWETTTP